MKAIFFTLTATLVSLSAASANTKVTCTNHPGGYDVETVTYSLNAKNEVVGLNYTSYQGDSVKFNKTSANTFEYTNSDLVLNSIVTVVPEKNVAVLNVVYKTSGQLLSASVFECK